MERDFKQEFIELKQNEIPDLWNRIEAGLSEKKVTASVSIKTDFSFKKINWRRWGTLAAACLCVIIIIPAISLIIRNNDGSSYSGGQSNGSMSSPAMDNTTANTTADCGMSVKPDDDGVNGDMEMVQGNDTSAAPSEAEYTDETVETEEEVRTENSKEINDLNLKNGQTIENVLVQIVEAGAAGEEVIYQAVVIEPDEDANLKENMQIEIVCNSDTEYDSLSMTEKEMLKDRDDYVVSLRLEQDRFVVINVAKVD